MNTDATDAATPATKAAEAAADLAVPRHIAIIMDGNGRWAEEQGKRRLFGHRAGVESVRQVVEAARDLGVRHLTLYAFSTENWRRPAAEVSGLMGLLKSFLRSELRTMLKNGVRLRCLGETGHLPDAVREILARTIAETARCQGMTLNLALSYGSRDELLRAARSLAQDCVEGRLRPEDIDEARLSSRLDSADQPDPDLLIRTSGEHRLSNFLLWQLSYAELYFTDTRWPDFRREHLIAAIADYNRRQRRFGRTGAQLQPASPESA